MEMTEHEMLVHAITLLRRFKAFRGAGSAPHVKRQFEDLLKQIDKFIEETKEAM